MAPRKKKSKEYGTSGLDFQTSFPYSSDLETPETIQLRKWDFWESLRRHPEYIELCKELEFNKITGLVSMKWEINLENRDKLRRATDKARDLFGVESIMDPNREFWSGDKKRDPRSPMLPPGVVETLGVAPVAVTLIAPHIRPGQTFPDADSYKRRFIKDGRFITLQLDITQPDDEIRQKVKHFISEQRALAGIASPVTRTRFKKANDIKEAFQVYDLKVAGKMMDTAIIKKLWPTEFKEAKGSNEAVRQRKYVALSRKYKAEGLKNYDDRAVNEAFRGVGFLYQRVTDRYLSAKKRIEGLTQK